MRVPEKYAATALGQSGSVSVHSAPARLSPAWLQVGSLVLVLGARVLGLVHVAQLTWFGSG